MMAIKALTPSFSLVFSFWFVVSMEMLSLETLLLSLDTSSLLVTIFVARLF
jgi:hypothetical protein